MKIGIQHCGLKHIFTDEEIMEKLSRIGYDAVDYALYIDWQKPDKIFNEPYAVWGKFFENTKKSAVKCGISFSQTHGTYPVDFLNYGVFGEKEKVQIDKELEATAILGAPYIVIHPIYIADVKKALNRDKSIEIYSELDETAKAYGVKIAIENMWCIEQGRFVSTGCSTSEELKQIIEGLENDRFVCCLDTGHTHLIGEDVVAAVKILGGKLKTLHVNDNFANRDNHFVPGIGDIDFNRFVQALKEIKYDGTFNMEIENLRITKIDKDCVWDYVGLAYKTAKKLIENNGL